jgi:hypothetical protein
MGAANGNEQKVKTAFKNAKHIGRTTAVTPPMASTGLLVAPVKRHLTNYPAGDFTPDWQPLR